MVKVTNTFRTLATSTHALEEREPNDFYATEPKAVKLLLEKESFNDNILEPCCGKLHITKELEKHNYNVTSSDLIDRDVNCEVKDFSDITEWNGDIVTNPPYKTALEFIKHSLEIINDGNKVAMFLKIQFLEGKARKEFFKEHPPKIIYVASSRLNCAKNGDFDKYKSSAVCYAWFVWEKGSKEDTIVKWIN